MTESSQPSHTPPLVEIRYFAAPRDDWELLLLRARQLGADTVVARVPWGWHATTERTVDLAGATDERRDLVGFVRLCGQFGLRVLLNPGPVHDDLLGGGAPAWLLQQHPAACALDQHGAPWLDAGGLPRPSALHPAFLAAARDWIAVFSAAMCAHQAPSGPIIALQIGTTAASKMNDWLRAEGWSIALQHEDATGLPPAQPQGPHTQPQAALLLELPGARHPLLNALPTPPSWLRSDGSPRPDFWRVKMSGLLFASAGSNAAHASVPADLALASASAPQHPEPVRAAGVALAQLLRQASMAFDLIDLDSTTPQDLARYTLIILPGALTLAPATMQQLRLAANIALLSDQADAPALTSSEEDDLAHATRLPIDIGVDQLAELIEQRGGVARYAWADSANIDLAVRYGASHTYLAINNRRPTAYNGILAYRGRDGAVLHLHTGIGARCAGMVLLTDDEVYGAAIDGDAAEGGWLARGLRSSAMFNSGAGALARCGTGLLLTAPQSGRFQARRAEGWLGMRAHRLLLSGALLPAHVQIDAAHISIAYVAEDARGPTDLYIVLPDGEVPPTVREYLASLLAARTAMLRRAALLAEAARTQPAPLDMVAQIVEPFRAAADQLAAAAEQLSTPDGYSAAWAAADELCQPAFTALSQALTQARGALLAGQLDPAVYEASERLIAQVSGVARRFNSLDRDSTS
jgi:hypothetical protein